jgi:hypothetical protein
MIAFTICSNNYLAEALTLGDSLVNTGFHSNKYIIFLVDKFHEDIEYNNLKYSVIQVSDEIVKDFNSISSYYNIIELSTSVKPSLFKYLIKKFTAEDTFAYLDPDLFFKQNIEDYVVQELNNASILLTPHLLNPVKLNRDPFENIFLNFGIYNLGFITIKVNQNSVEMLDWWEERTLKLGIINVKEGLFVDQLWINLVPIFFKDIQITLHPGFNVAYWNIEERELKKIENIYLINNKFPLIFFHFSSFDFSLRKLSKRKYTELSYNIVHLNELMVEYKMFLEKNNFHQFKKISPKYQVSFQNFILKKLSPNTSIRKAKIIKKLIQLTPKKILKKFLNFAHITDTIYRGDL